MGFVCNCFNISYKKILQNKENNIYVFNDVTHDIVYNLLKDYIEFKKHNIELLDLDKILGETKYLLKNKYNICDEAQLDYIILKNLKTLIHKNSKFNKIINKKIKNLNPCSYI